MRDVVFFVPDMTTEYVVSGFLERRDCHEPHNLNTGPFTFDPAEDLIRIPGNDGGVFTRGHEWAQAYLRRHRHAVLVFDREYGTARDASSLRDDLAQRIQQSGWPADRFKVIVIEPEIESWMWQRNHRVAKPLGFASVPEMVAAVRNGGLDWPDGALKPSRPKEALQLVVRQQRIGWSSAIHRSIVRNVTLIGCRDHAFTELRGALQHWFPKGGEA